MNCEYIIGMLENYVIELGLILIVKWGLYVDEF